jgi:hypothetical protein
MLRPSRHATAGQAWRCECASGRRGGGGVNLASKTGGEGDCFGGGGIGVLLSNRGRQHSAAVPALNFQPLLAAHNGEAVASAQR